MMETELDILRDVSERLESAGIEYMLTGSVAMNYYAQPRMTRDIDLVVALDDVRKEIIVGQGIKARDATRRCAKPARV